MVASPTLVVGCGPILRGTWIEANPRAYMTEGEKGGLLGGGERGSLRFGSTTLGAPTPLPFPLMLARSCHRRHPGAWSRRGGGGGS